MKVEKSDFDLHFLIIEAYYFAFIQNDCIEEVKTFGV